MDLVLTFLGCSVVGFSLIYWSDIKNIIQQKMTTSKPLKGVISKSLREEYYEAYEYLAKEFGVRTNVLIETKDKDYRINYVRKYRTNQPKCLIPAMTYNDKEFMQHFITIANLYNDFDSEDLIKKYLPNHVQTTEEKVKCRLSSLGIDYRKGGY